MQGKVDLFDFWLGGLHKLGGDFKLAQIEPTVRTKPNNNPPTLPLPLPRIAHGYERDRKGCLHKVPVSA